MNDPTDFSAFAAQQSQGMKPVLRFETIAVELPGKSAQEGRPIFEDRDFVTIIVPGSKDEVHRRADEKAKVDPYIAQAYEQWKKTKQQPVDGTPLTEAPFLRPSQIKEMQSQNVLSIENLANLSDVQAQRVGFDGMTLRDKARVYLENAKDSSFAMKLDAENSALKRDMAALREQFDALVAQLEKKGKAA